jgi:hypothetical protein
MGARVLRDQKPDGGWNIKEPDWDVHALSRGHAMRPGKVCGTT